MLEADPGKWQVDVVVDDQEVCGLGSEVSQQRGHRLPRLVHECGRECQHGPLLPDPDLADLGPDGAPGAFERSSVAIGERDNDVGSKIVPRLPIALAWVAKPDDDGDC